MDAVSPTHIPLRLAGDLHVLAKMEEFPIQEEDLVLEP